MSASRETHSRNSSVEHGCVAFCLLLLFGSSGLAGQGAFPGVALGVAVPSGDYGDTRGTGPLAQLFVVFGGPDRRLRLRLDAEGVWLPARGPDNPVSIPGGDMRILSGIANLIIGPRGSEARPYFLFGVAKQWVSVTNGTNPYGAVPGARAGFGVEVPIRHWTVRAEIAAHAVLSDFATGHDFGLGTYWPVTVAIQF